MHTHIYTHTHAHTGITLLPASAVETLLLEKRRHELVQPFKLALLKLASQVHGLLRPILSGLPY